MQCSLTFSVAKKVYEKRSVRGCSVFNGTWLVKVTPEIEFLSTIDQFELMDVLDAVRFDGTTSLV